MLSFIDFNYKSKPGKGLLNFVASAIGAILTFFAHILHFSGTMAKGLVEVDGSAFAEPPTLPVDALQLRLIITFGKDLHNDHGGAPAAEEEEKQPADRMHSHRR